MSDVTVLLRTVAGNDRFRDDALPRGLPTAAGRQPHRLRHPRPPPHVGVPSA